MWRGKRHVRPLGNVSRFRRCRLNTTCRRHPRKELNRENGSHGIEGQVRDCLNDVGDKDQTARKNRTKLQNSGFCGAPMTHPPHLRNFLGAKIRDNLAQTHPSADTPMVGHRASCAPAHPGFRKAAKQLGSLLCSRAQRRVNHSLHPSNPHLLMILPTLAWSGCPLHRVRVHRATSHGDGPPGQLVRPGGQRTTEASGHTRSTLIRGVASVPVRE